MRRDYAGVAHKTCCPPLFFTGKSVGHCAGRPWLREHLKILACHTNIVGFCVRIARFRI
jgi:hypothetical protein